MSYGKLAHAYVGVKLTLTVLRSGAGFYIGTRDEDGGPVSRESQEYFTTRQEAGDALRNGTWTQNQRP